MPIPMLSYEAIYHSTRSSVRRAKCHSMIIQQELVTYQNENPMQVPFIIENDRRDFRGAGYV